MIANFETLREALARSEKEIGRAELARLMGLTATQYRNQIDKLNGCKGFSGDQLDDIAFLTDSDHIAEYFAFKRGKMLVDIPSADIDLEELSEIQMKEMSSIGALNVTLAKAVADGQITKAEESEIYRDMLSACASLINSKLATINLYKTGK